MEHYGYARGAVYGHTVPAVGGDEEVVACAALVGTVKTEGRHGGGVGGVWEYIWRYRCRPHDTAGCVEDAVDACAEAGRHSKHHEQDLERRGREGLLQWSGTEDHVDQHWRSGVSRELPMGEQSAWWCGLKRSNHCTTL